MKPEPSYEVLRAKAACLLSIVVVLLVAALTGLILQVRFDHKSDRELPDPAIADRPGDQASNWVEGVEQWQPADAAQVTPATPTTVASVAPKKKS